MFDGDGQNFAVRLEDGARACRRNVRVFDFVTDIHEVRPHRREIACHADIYSVLLSCRGIEEMNRAELLVHDCVRTCGSRFDIHAVAPKRRAHLLRLCVVDVEIHGAIAVGKEVHVVAHPHRRRVVRILARNLYHRRNGKIGDPDRRSSAATIVLQAAVVQRRFREICERDISQMGAVRRVRTFNCLRQRQPFRQSAGEADCVELCYARIAIAARAEENARAIACPAQNLICAGVRGQPFRNSTRRRNHVNIFIAVVFPGEGNLCPIGRKHRIDLNSDIACQTSRIAAAAVHDPQVAAIAERDLRFAHGRLAQQWVLIARLRDYVLIRGQKQQRPKSNRHGQSNYRRAESCRHNRESPR